jgi:hypothetical protein
VNSSPPRRGRRWFVIIGLTVLLVVSAGFAVLRAAFEGPALGDNIASLLNKRMRGRIDIGSIEWSTGSLTTAVMGGWVPLTLRDVRLWDDCALSAPATGEEASALRSGDPNEDCTPDDHPDPDPRSHRKPRKLLVRTDLITVDIDIHAVMFGHHDFVFRNLWLHGGEALLEQTREPYPLLAYDRMIVSIVSAFYPRMNAGFHAGIYADSPPPLFDLRDIHITGLNLTVHWQPYATNNSAEAEFGFTARLEGIEADSGPIPANNSYLYMDPTDPLIARFYFRLGVTARRGLIRLQDSGPRSAFRLPRPGQPAVYPPAERRAAYSFALSDIQLHRLAQLPMSWSRHDFVAKTLALDLEARTAPCPTGPDGPGLVSLSRSTAPATDADRAAQLRFSGELSEYFDRLYGGAWNLKLDAHNLGPMIRSCVRPELGGDQLDGTVSLTGPFVASPAVGLDLTGVDVDIPISGTQPPLRLTLAELHGKIDLVNEEGYFEKTKALVSGGKEPGEVELSATVGFNPAYANTQIEIAKAIDIGRFLQARLAHSVGRFLQGRLRLITANSAASVASAVPRTPAVPAPPGVAAPSTVQKPSSNRDRTMVSVDDIDLTLGATPQDKAIRFHHGRVSLDDTKAVALKFDSLQVEAGRSHAELDGTIDVAGDQIDLRISGEFPDLDVWLARFNLPVWVKSAGSGGGITITGPLKNPTFTASDTVLAGVPCLDRLELGRIVVRDRNTVTVSKLSSPGLGGQLTGDGVIRIGGAVPVVEKLTLSGSRLDASKLCGLKGVVKGTIDELSASLHGELDPHRTALEWLGLVQGYARAEHLTVLDDHYSAITACVNHKDDRACRPRPTELKPDDLKQCADGKRAGLASASGFCLVAAATRDAGGTLDATIAQLPGVRTSRGAATGPHLAGLVALSKLPLALIDQLRGKPGATSVGGLVSLALRLEGAPSAPQAQGAVQLMRGWLSHGFLGDAAIEVKPATLRGVPAVAFEGSALAGQLAITGSLGTTAPYPVELSIRARRIEVDPFVDLQALLGQSDPIQAWASGTITLRTELAPRRPIEPEVWIELSELAAQIDHRASDGRITPLAIRIKDQSPGQRAAMSLHVTPSSIELACRDAKAPDGRAECSTILETPAGEIVLRGHANQSSVQITASGDLDLSKLHALLDQQFDQVTGRVRLRASVGGALTKPTVDAEIDLDPDQIGQRNEAERQARHAAALARVERAPHPLEPGEDPVVLRPVGSDTRVTAPRGQIKLAYGTIGFNDVVVQIQDDRHEGDAGELHLRGTIGLAGLTPVSWSVLLSGKFAGKMLQVLAPTLVAQASGLIDIDGDLVLSGTGPRPAVSGLLQFDRDYHVSIIPRGVHRELSFHTGSLDIDTDTSADRRVYKLNIADVAGTLDDGQLSNIAGSLRMRDGELISAKLYLDATGIPFRLPQTLDLVVSATGIQIAFDGPGSNWKVDGTVTVIDGAYKRNFELTDRIQSIGVNTGTTKPFWEEYPILGSAELNLRLVVQLFAVRNNIATIEFRSDEMPLTGTPRDPRLSGQIRVTHGEFHIPGTRAAFTRTTGTVDFAENQRAANPELNVASDADYRDLSGQDHVITATISGSLQQPAWDLKTSTGYNKSQTLSLLLLGRSQEQLRRSLGDQSLGSDPLRVDPTTNPSQGIADQVVKDLAGDWVSGLIGSSLTKLTGLDVVRIEIGFGSIGLHLEKKIVDNAQLLVNAEQTIRGATVKAVAELKLPFKVSLQIGYLNQNYYDPAEQDVTDYNVKLVYRYRVFIP